MASTYVNDLRLNELATGDASGTWGTITNTNFELIAEAFSFDTEAITTNADTHTTTVADGATDPGRSIYLKYTGTLDSACTITIGPNTISKLWFIENGTSGSQNIIISQGSGANVTIPAGDTKVIYSDGAGSGAAVVDAFASLSVVDLKVQDDLTVTDDVSVGGDLTVTGDADVDGTLEADAMTLNGTAITTTATLSTGISNNNVPKFTSGVVDDDFLRVNGTAIEGRSASEVLSDIGASAAAGSSSIVTTGALDSGSITSGFGTIDTGSSTITTTGAVTGGSLVADNITIDGTEIDLSSGDLTIDVAGDIILDADGENIKFKDAGTEVGQIDLGSQNFTFRSQVDDKDIIFRGQDSTSEIVALTLDMSEGGSATFNKDIMLSDNSALRLGTGQDLALFHDATDSTIRNTTGDLIFDVAGDIVLDADGGDFTFKDGGTTKFQLQNSSDDIQFVNNTQDKDIKFMGDDGGSTITALTLDMSEAGAATFNNNVTAFSDERLKDNIETLEDGLDKVEQLRGVTYTRDDKENIGVIAQEVEKILPEIVLTADDEMGTKSVDYSRITAVLIEAVKELSARVKELENK